METIELKGAKITVLNAKKMQKKENKVEIETEEVKVIWSVSES